MLPEIRVSSPCTANWEEMTGDDRIRHCAQCNLDVYNFSTLTRREIEQLLETSCGRRLCGRLYRRVDGTLLTRDCPVGFRTRVRRFSRRVGVALSAAMSVGTAIAQTDQKPSVPPLVQIGQSGAATDSVATNLFGVVTDVSGAVIPKAKISVKSKSGKVVRGIADSRGRFTITIGAPGPYEVTARAVGFKPFVASDVPGGRSLNIDIVLTVDSEIMMGVIATDGVPTETSEVNPFLPESTPTTPTSTAPSAKPNSATPPNSLKHFFSTVGRKLGF